MAANASPGTYGLYSAVASPAWRLGPAQGTAGALQGVVEISLPLTQPLEPVTEPLLGGLQHLHRLHLTCPSGLTCSAAVCTAGRSTAGWMQLGWQWAR